MPNIFKRGGDVVGEELAPPDPIFFTKAPTSVIGPYDDIIYLKAIFLLDYEVEPAFVLGRKGKYLTREEGYEYIMG